MENKIYIVPDLEEAQREAGSVPEKIQEVHEDHAEKVHRRDQRDGSHIQALWLNRELRKIGREVIWLGREWQQLGPEICDKQVY